MKSLRRLPITLTTTSYPGWPELEFALCRNEEELEAVFMDLKSEGAVNFEIFHGRSGSNIIIDPQKYEEVLQWLNDMHLFNHYSMPDVCDGTGWELNFPFHRGGTRRIYGHMYFPPEYEQLIEKVLGKKTFEDEEEVEDEEDENWDPRTEGPWFMDLNDLHSRHNLFSMHRRKGQYDYLLTIGHYQMKYYDPIGIASKKGSYSHARAEVVKVLHDVVLQPPTKEDCTYIRIKSYPKYTEYLFGPGTDVSGLKKVLSRFLPLSCLTELLYF